jgi:hypothetical protein
LFSSCRLYSHKYYLGHKADQKIFAFNWYYVLAEKKGDSVHLKYITDPLNAWIYWDDSAEVLPLKPFKGKNFIIDKVKKHRIEGRRFMNFHGRKCFVPFVLHEQRRAKKYHYLIHFANSKDIEYDFKDSTIRVLFLQEKNYYILPEGEWLDNSLRKLHSDSFPKAYTEFMRVKLDSVRRMAVCKKAFCDSIESGLLLPDSVNYARLLHSYLPDYYDNHAFYLMISRNPELFFLKSLNPADLYDCISDYPACFKWTEIREMYCKLKSLGYKDPDRRLQMFESRGDLKCQ